MVQICWWLSLIKYLFFEITDHLGSVRAIVKGTKTVAGNADIVSLRDYYAFGATMRKFVSGDADGVRIYHTSNSNQKAGQPGNTKTPDDVLAEIMADLKPDEEIGDVIFSVHSNKESGNTSFFPGTPFKLALKDKTVDNDPVLHFISDINNLMGEGSSMYLITCWIGPKIGEKIVEKANLTHDFYFPAVKDILYPGILNKTTNKPNFYKGFFRYIKGKILDVIGGREKIYK